MADMVLMSLEHHAFSRSIVFSNIGRIGEIRRNWLVNPHVDILRPKAKAESVMVDTHHGTC